MTPTQLIEDNVATTRRMSSAIWRRLPKRRGFDLDEAVAAGLYVLVQAAMSFDPARGSPFQSYLWQSLRRELRRWAGQYGREEQGVKDQPAAPEPEPFDEMIAELDADERAVIHGRFADGKSRVRLAIELGLTPRAVQSIEESALRRLR